jgi:MFS family permease
MSRDPLLTRAFVVCAVANFLQSLSFNLFLHLPGFLHDLGASEVRIGLISGVWAVAAIAARPPLGRFMDRFGRRRLVLAASLANVAVTALHAAVVDLGPWIYVLRALHGASEAILFTVLFTVAVDRVPASRRTEGLALYSATGMLPISLGGLLGDAILARADYDALFFTSSAIAALSFGVALGVREAPRPPHEAAAIPRGFVHALGRRDLLPLWMIGTVFGIVLSGVFVFVKRFTMETDTGTLGAFFSAYIGAAITVRLVGGRLPDRVGPKRVLVPALVTLVAGFFCLAIASEAREVLAAGVLCGIGHGFAYPTLSSLIVTRAGEADRAAAIAVLTTLPDVGALLGAPSLGWIIELAGFSAMFATAGVALALGIAAFAAWDRNTLETPLPA